jgi:ribose transport system permease protein
MVIGHAMTQERIVLAIGVLLAIAFTLFLPGFATLDNMLSLIRSVATIGVLGTAMAIVIIGRGIDLSLIAVMVMPAAWIVVQIGNGVSTGTAAISAMIAALILAVVNGWLVAYAEVPAIFATIATGIIVYGFFQFFFVPNDVVPFPPQIQWWSDFWISRPFGVPVTIIYFGIVLLLAWGFLRYTRAGRYIYAIGDNPTASRNTGVPVRPIQMLQYLITSLIAFATGVVLAGTVSSANTRLFNSTLVYDVILVVVLGGVGLSGGKGSIRNVVIGTLLIGVLINGMILMDISENVQNLIKAAILLLAIAIDSIINPRDEQISQQGDI